MALDRTIFNLISEDLPERYRTLMNRNHITIQDAIRQQLIGAPTVSGLFTVVDFDPVYQGVVLQHQTTKLLYWVTAFDFFRTDDSWKLYQKAQELGFKASWTVEPFEQWGFGYVGDVYNVEYDNPAIVIEEPDQQIRNEIITAGRQPIAVSSATPSLIGGKWELWRKSAYQDMPFLRDVWDPTYWSPTILFEIVDFTDSTERFGYQSRRRRKERHFILKNPLSGEYFQWSVAKKWMPKYLKNYAKGERFSACVRIAPLTSTVYVDETGLYEEVTNIRDFDRRRFPPQLDSEYRMRARKDGHAAAIYRLSVDIVAHPDRQNWENYDRDAFDMDDGVPIRDFRLQEVVEGKGNRFTLYLTHLNTREVYRYDVPRNAWEPAAEALLRSASFDFFDVRATAKGTDLNRSQYTGSGLVSVIDINRFSFVEIGSNGEVVTYHAIPKSERTRTAYQVTVAARQQVRYDAQLAQREQELAEAQRAREELERTQRRLDERAEVVAQQQRDLDAQQAEAAREAERSRQVVDELLPGADVPTEPLVTGRRRTRTPRGIPTQRATPPAPTPEPTPERLYHPEEEPERAELEIYDDDEPDVVEAKVQAVEAEHDRAELEIRVTEAEAEQIRIERERTEAEQAERDAVARAEWEAGREERERQTRAEALRRRRLIEAEMHEADRKRREEAAPEPLTHDETERAELEIGGGIEIPADIEAEIEASERELEFEDLDLDIEEPRESAPKPVSGVDYGRLAQAHGERREEAQQELRAAKAALDRDGEDAERAFEQAQDRFRRARTMARV